MRWPPASTRPRPRSPRQTEVPRWPSGRTAASPHHRRRCGDQSSLRSPASTVPLRPLPSAMRSPGGRRHARGAHRRAHGGAAHRPTRAADGRPPDPASAAGHTVTATRRGRPPHGAGTARGCRASPTRWVHGTATAQFRQVGNAVCPPVGEDHRAQHCGCAVAGRSCAEVSANGPAARSSAPRRVSRASPVRVVPRRPTWPDLLEALRGSPRTGSQALARELAWRGTTTHEAIREGDAPCVPAAGPLRRSARSRDDGPPR